MDIEYSKISAENFSLISSPNCIQDYALLHPENLNFFFYYVRVEVEKSEDVQSISKEEFKFMIEGIYFLYSQLKDTNMEDLLIGSWGLISLLLIQERKSGLACYAKYSEEMMKHNSINKLTSFMTKHNYSDEILKSKEFINFLLKKMKFCYTEMEISVQKEIIHMMLLKFDPFEVTKFLSNKKRDVYNAKFTCIVISLIRTYR